MSDNPTKIDISQWIVFIMSKIMTANMNVDVLPMMTLFPMYFGEKKHKIKLIKMKKKKKKKMYRTLTSSVDARIHSLLAFVFISKSCCQQWPISYNILSIVSSIHIN